MRLLSDESIYYYSISASDRYEKEVLQKFFDKLHKNGAVWLHKLMQKEDSKKENKQK